MRAELIDDVRYPVADRAFVEIVIWQVPAALAGSSHLFKYRMVLIVEDESVIRYDNEAGKGDHRHVGGPEFPHDFRSVEDLRVDFWTEVGEWLKRNGAR